MGNLNGIYGESGFNTHSVEPSSGDDFELLPIGWYDVEVEDAVVKDTKAGNGCYLELKLTVVGEKFNGRKIWHTITLQNPNQKAVEIGQRNLAALGQACELNTLKDTDELLGKVVQAKVKINPENNGYKASNDISSYKACGITTSQQPQTAPSNTTPSDSGSRPWER